MKRKPTPTRSGSEVRRVVSANIKMLPDELLVLDAHVRMTGHASRVSYVRTALWILRDIHAGNMDLGLETCWQCGAGVIAGDGCNACGAA